LEKTGLVNGVLPAKEEAPHVTCLRDMAYQNVGKATQRGQSKKNLQTEKLRKLECQWALSLMI
jgi:hypothetical protein